MIVFLMSFIPLLVLGVFLTAREIGDLRNRVSKLEKQNDDRSERNG